jgi:hypothetical protein
MSNPSCHSGNSEKHGEHISRETHRAIDEPTVKINVGVKFSRNAA